MKNFIYFVLFCVVCYFLYNRCWGVSSSDSKVKKQVTVTARTANLRTGPGTDYDFATADTDSTGEKLQVSRGTKLEVVAQKNGWYEVRIPGGDERTAYIKQSLCSDGNAKGTSRKEKGKRSSGSGSRPATSDNAHAAPSSSASSSSSAASSSSSASDDDFEEEVEEATYIPQTR